MAAPPTTARATPAGIKLDDGFSTVIAMAGDPDISFWEKTVKPPGIDGGDAVETTTMHNTVWRTMSPRALRTLTECTFTAAYDPGVFDQIVNIINYEQGFTIHFPDGSTLDFYGFLKNFEPQDMSEGAQPEASITISPTNQDPTSGAEEAPVLTSVAGT